MTSAFNLTYALASTVMMPTDGVLWFVRLQSRLQYHGFGKERLVLAARSKAMLDHGTYREEKTTRRWFVTFWPEAAA